MFKMLKLGKNINGDGNMKKGNRIIKTLEIIAITILIFCFIVLVYCVYISITKEKEYVNEYRAETMSVNKKESDKATEDISNLIENVNNSVVGISKLKSKGSTIFLEDGATNLG